MLVFHFKFNSNTNDLFWVTNDWRNLLFIDRHYFVVVVKHRLLTLLEKEQFKDILSAEIANNQNCTDYMSKKKIKDYCKDWERETGIIEGITSVQQKCVCTTVTLFLM